MYKSAIVRVIRPNATTKPSANQVKSLNLLDENTEIVYKPLKFRLKNIRTRTIPRPNLLKSPPTPPFIPFFSLFSGDYSHSSYKTTATRRLLSFLGLHETSACSWSESISTSRAPIRPDEPRFFVFLPFLCQIKANLVQTWPKKVKMTRKNVSGGWFIRDKQSFPSPVLLCLKTKWSLVSFCPFFGLKTTQISAFCL